MDDMINHGTRVTVGTSNKKATFPHPTSTNRFSKMKLLGSGTFGEEVSSDHLGINMMVIREISLLRKLSHPNITTILDVLIGEKVNCKGLLVVMELEEMDLHDYQMKFGKLLCLSKAQFIIRQVLEGCSYLHSNHIMHRDLKPDNILISSSTGMTRIADFGYARTFSNVTSTAACSTQYSWPIQAPSYKAPEVLLGCDCYTSAVDVWSIGCIFCELLSGGRKLFGAVEVAPELESVKRSNRKRGRHGDSLSVTSQPNQVDRFANKVAISSVSSSCEKNETLLTSLTAIFKIFGPLSDSHAPALRQLSSYAKFTSMMQESCLRAESGSENDISCDALCTLLALVEPRMRDCVAVGLVVQLLNVDPVERVTCISALSNCFFNSAMWSSVG